MNINILNHNLFSLGIILIISILVAFRDYSVGIDTANYAYIYTENSGFQGFEPGFRFLIEFFNLLTPSPVLFFGFICFLISVFHYLTYKNISYIDKNNLTFLILFFSLMFFSSWYINNITNGLRQGISLSILLYALVKYFIKKKYIKFAIFYGFSILFHKSSIFLLPFLLIYHIFSFKIFFYLWIILGLNYILGINEIFLQKILSFIGYEHIYLLIKEYGLPEKNYYGFNLSFFIYTISFPLLSLFIYYTSKNLEKFLPVQMLKLYMMLCLPYFILGFANYSNRYAFIAWAFIPFLQLIIIKQLNLSKRSLFILSISLFCFGIMYFYLFRFNFINFFTLGI